VGDEGFQRKCFDKLNDFQRNNITIIIVSHNMSNITKHCSRVLFINKSKIQLEGKPEQVVSDYLARIK
jgi:lipopolysaccharide transport system ATP-binding protein